MQAFIISVSSSQKGYGANHDQKVRKVPFADGCGSRGPSLLTSSANSFICPLVVLWLWLIKLLSAKISKGAFTPMF